jgi:hypothetical protein
VRDLERELDGSARVGAGVNRTDRLLSARGYARRVGLLACPFCREMFEEGEAKACPVCGMALAQLHKLPPSIDAMHDEAGVPTAPELEPLPLSYLGRGKGPLAVLGLAGLAFFFLPWVRLTMPYIDAKSAFDLAHERIGWLWGICAAWVVLVPTVLSRRSIVQMRGARVAAAFLSAIPTVAIGILLAKPPKGAIIPVKYTWDWPMWATLGVSLLAIAFSVRLGGSLDDIEVRRGSSKGQQLH